MAIYIIEVIEENPKSGCSAGAIIFVGILVLLWVLLGGPEKAEKNNKEQIIEAESPAQQTDRVDNNASEAISVDPFQESDSGNKDGSNNKNDHNDTVNSANQAGRAATLSSQLFLGEWKGSFGRKYLTLVIESIDDDGNVKGYNSLGNNKRDVSGFKVGNDFELKENGINKWDGIFKFTIMDSVANGTWKSYNGLLTRQYSLKR
jgi:hypothetical protein